MEDLLKFAPRPTGMGEMFQVLRDGQPRTRADLAAITGQARSTIAARLDLLVSTGLIGPAGEASSTGGRPPATFAFRPSAKVVLAVEVGVTNVHLAVTDLSSTILAEAELPLAVADGPDVVMSKVAETGRKLMATADRSPEELASVGVGLPGPVEYATGRPINPPAMPSWDAVDIPQVLERLLKVPVLVDKDVNLMALGEHRTNWRTVRDMLFVNVATSIGSGIISDGELRRGAQGAAGDIGHIAVPTAKDVLCWCGNAGCLEAVASGNAIAAWLRARGLIANDTSDVVALIRSGDVTTSRAVRQAGREIGSVLAACVSMLNPSLIVVGGVISDTSEHLIAGIRELVYQSSLPLATEHLRIVTSRNWSRVGVIGASAMAVEHVLSPRAIDALGP
ncbi:ROK family protein [Virgisporangium ochraceum]|uniref:Sugar kinase n=1 Tax=Virgisporangium ochraceum TaxID=65505 RepID=A0A8J4EI63_9ACTN|nr:ROK family protein [Virgisporangium ochraceum]GIJ75433.1 sugar kinase [Virgisporangium ochraceum]